MSCQSSSCYKQDNCSFHKQLLMTKVTVAFQNNLTLLLNKVIFLEPAHGVREKRSNMTMYCPQTLHKHQLQAEAN